MCKLGGKPTQPKNWVNLPNCNEKSPSGVGNSNYPIATKYSHILTENFQCTNIWTGKETEIDSTDCIWYIDDLKSGCRHKNIIQLTRTNSV